MPYTFGGAVGSRCTITSNVSTGANSTAGIFTGWYLPTTLTATRRYFSAGAIFGAEVGSTTSEIVLRTDNTTDGQWTTSGAGITTGIWYFLAVLYVASNTGPVCNWRVYLGTSETPPVLQSLTNNTAPAGNFVGSTTVTFGNTSANNVAFQGDIADISYFATSSFGATTSPLNISVATALTADEEAHILRRYILPMYEGNPARAWANVPIGANVYDSWYWSGLALANAQRRTNTLTSTTWIAPTLTSSVVSLNGSPRPARSPVLAGPFLPR